MCDVDFDEPWAVWTEKVRKARKQHECDGCGALIKPGDRYLHHSHVGDGTARSEKCCLACEQAREAFRNAHHGAVYAPGFLSNSLRECMENAEDEAEADAWRPMLAGLLARWRVSPSGRQVLRETWAERATP